MDHIMSCFVSTSTTTASTSTTFFSTNLTQWNHTNCVTTQLSCNPAIIRLFPPCHSSIFYSFMLSRFYAIKQSLNCVIMTPSHHPITMPISDYVIIRILHEDHFEPCCIGLIISVNFLLSFSQ